MKAYRVERAMPNGFVLVAYYTSKGLDGLLDTLSAKAVRKLLVTFITIQR